MRDLSVRDGKAVDWVEHVTDSSTASVRRAADDRQETVLKLLVRAFAITLGLIGPAMAQQRVLISFDWGKSYCRTDGQQRDQSAEPISYGSTFPAAAANC